MNVKTYRGKSLEECFQLVKTDMGRDAVILQSRAYHPIFGRFGKQRHEVIAARELAAPDARPARPAEPPASTGRVYGYSPGSAPLVTPRLGEGLAAGRAAVAAAQIHAAAQAQTASVAIAAPPEAREVLPATTGNDQDERLERLEKQLSTLAASMQRLTDVSVARGKGVKAAAVAEAPPETYAALRKKLLESQIAEPLVRRMVEELPGGLSDSEAVSEMRTLIAQRLKIAPGLQPAAGKTRVVAFVGPTGVGKTTTLTKIAARLALVEGHSVGIVSMDTHRIAAAKQLETYGEILRVPVKIAYSAAELAQHVDGYAAEKLDFVLIDTAGKSPNDALPLAEIANALKDVANVTRCLCMPATVSAGNMEHLVARFHSLLAPDALIITKLDEAADGGHLGHLLNTQAKYGVPLAYLTNGQRVPDDLASPDAHAIADRLLAAVSLR